MPHASLIAVHARLPYRDKACQARRPRTIAREIDLCIAALAVKGPEGHHNAMAAVWRATAVEDTI
jgi:hypothetical protein